MIAKYLPEGCRTGRRENSRYLCGIKGIEEAYLCGAVIEDIALRCNNDMSLEFDLGGIRGYMPRHESAYVIDDIVKDIAVITRVGKAVCFKVINIIKDEKGRELIDNFAKALETTPEKIAQKLPKLSEYNENIDDEIICMFAEKIKTAGNFANAQYKISYEEMIEIYKELFQNNG